MITRSKDGTRKPKILYSSKHSLPRALMTQTLTSIPEPTTLKQASRDPRWVQAMKDEYTALLHNHTWTLVPYHSSMNVVGCRWVYKIKERSEQATAFAQ